MEQTYFIPTVVCLKAKNNGYIVQDADFRITRKLKQGVWRNIITEDSMWANPFKCHSEEEKPDCLQKYEAYIRKAINDNPQTYFPELYRMVTMGRPATLGCFCKKTGNEGCHGDVIVKIAAEFIQQLREGKIPQQFLIKQSHVQPNLTQNFQQNLNLINQNSIQKMNPTELPYATIFVNGIQPSDTSRLVILQVNDPDVGQFTVNLFLTAGSIPGQIIHTQFGEGGQGKEYNGQKHTIHEQNKVTLREPGIPAKLSNGVDSKGVCAKKIKLFKSEPAAPVKITSCPDGQDRVMAVTTISIPPSATNVLLTTSTIPPIGGGFLAPSGFPTMPSTPVGGFVSPPVSSGGPPTTPVSGPGGEVPPPGAIPFEVVDIDTEKVSANPMYQLPGGPRPIGFSFKSKQPYFYLMPGDVIIKSTKKLVGPKDRELRDTALGAAQKVKAEKAKLISLQKYPIDRFPLSGSGATQSVSGARPPSVSVTPTAFPPQPSQPAPSILPSTFNFPSSLLPPPPSNMIVPSVPNPSAVAPSLFPPTNKITLNPSLLPPPSIILPQSSNNMMTPNLDYGGVMVTIPENDDSDEGEDTEYSSDEDNDEEIINVAVPLPFSNTLPSNSLFTPQPPNIIQGQNFTPLMTPPVLTSPPTGFGTLPTAQPTISPSIFAQPPAGLGSLPTTSTTSNQDLASLLASLPTNK